MKNRLIIILLLIPCTLMSQLKGEYLYFEGVYSEVITFDRSRFQVKIINDIYGVLGEGTYTISNDTLTFSYQQYADSSEYDCSSYAVTDSKINEESDSIRIKISVGDCQYANFVYFPSVLVVDSNNHELLRVKGNEFGRCEFSIPKNRSHSFKLIAAAPEYKSVEMKFDSTILSDITIDIDLFQAHYRIIPEGQIRRYVINEKHSKYLKLANINGGLGDSFIWIKIKKSWSEKKCIRKVGKYNPQFRR